MALVSSVVATGAIGTAMALADREQGAVAASPATVPPSSSNAGAAATTTPAATAGYADGVWTGASEFTRFGDVQVRVTIRGGELVDVSAVQIPSGRRSSEINARAEPVLESEAIARQGADLDMVSGATYTSESYASSLQSALDEASAAATGPS